MQKTDACAPVFWFQPAPVTALALCQFGAAFGAAAGDDGAATTGRHASAEAMFALARAFLRLISAFHVVLESTVEFRRGIVVLKKAWPV
jgi:hypothetical protein